MGKNSKRSSTLGLPKSSEPIGWPSDSEIEDVVGPTAVNDVLAVKLDINIHWFPL